MTMTGTDEGSIQEAPLSFAQERVWLDQQLNPDTLFYHIAHVYDISGSLDVRLLHRSLNILVERHHILRSVFYEKGKQVVQRVKSDFELAFPVFDFSGYIDPRAQAIHVIGQELKTPFDLAVDAPIRVRMIRTGPREHILSIVMNHIAGDHWSTQIFCKELSSVYNSLVRGSEPQLPDLPIQYRDFARWERNQENHMPFSDQEFWVRKFRDDLPILDLPLDKPRPLKQTFHGGIERLQLDEYVWKSLKEWCQRLQVTPFVLLLSAFGVLLHRLSGQSDLIIGTFLANRQRRELSPLVGILFNNLPVRIDLSGDPTFADLAKQVRDYLLDSFEHANYSYDRLIQETNAPRIGRRPSLYSTTFQLYYKGDEDALHMTGLTVTRRRIVGDVLYDLMGYAQETGSILKLWFNYNTDVFNKDTITRFLSYFACLLSRLALDGFASVSEIDFIPEDEKEDLINTYNRTGVPYTRDSSITDVFRQQATEVPDRVALIEPGKPDAALTYHELEERTDQLGNHLVSFGIKRGETVALLLSRSSELLVTYLAVLKIGGVCLVLDSDLPRERMRYMTKDSGARFVVTSRDIVNRNVISKRITQIEIDRDDIWGTGREAPRVAVDGESPAVIVYTSGSSGRPKGVQLLHRGLINQALHRIKILGLTRDDIVCLSLSLVFVTMPLQLLSAMLAGARLVVLPKSVLADPSLLMYEVDRLWINAVEVTVSGLARFVKNLDQDIPKPTFHSLRTILVAGEKLTTTVASGFHRHYPNVKLINAYGQTECSGMTLNMTIEAGNDGAICEGYPSQNNKVFILGENYSLVPFGVIGEIGISGDGVAAGYINKPSLTAEKFIRNPINPGGTLYLTGDLGRRWPNGCVEVLGRRDDQIKIRGYRVEPGEISSVLQKFLGITNAHVAAWQHMNDCVLVAYYSTYDKLPLDNNLLFSHLKSYLPEYMIPSVFEHIVEFPTNLNGKLDTKAFPKPDMTSKLKIRDKKRPETELELKISMIWETVLDCRDIGTNISLFELNGHSLHGVQITARISDQFGINLDPSSVFEYPTVQAFAKYIETLRLTNS